MTSSVPEQRPACPSWCADGPHGAPPAHLPDLLHTDDAVYYEGLVLHKGLDTIFRWQLGAYSLSDGTPGRPFVMMGPDYVHFEDPDAVEDVIDVLEEVLPKLRAWNEILRRYQEGALNA